MVFPAGVVVSDVLLEFAGGEGPCAISVAEGNAVGFEPDVVSLSLRTGASWVEDSAPGAAPAKGVDYVIELRLHGPAAVQEAWAPIKQRFARRVLLAVDQGRVQAALQLVSRAGVVSDAEVIEFRSMVETMAAQLAAAVHAPEMRQALEAARELDRICADTDIQVALHVVGIGFTPADFAGQAFQDAATYARDLYAWRLDREGRPHPPYAPWVARLQEFDPWRVTFAHDLAIWQREA